ncbi:DUF808 domain-containing protein [Roseateles koreensis]|uniref:DUF808 domain-containing protein n=1 Tax=Roseateles koreensis TaxID=2987526 RepID=A0ABT5KSC9_9BURK|nr:DUF808 domain-containing protein [Roseateles koreensis]MDC8784776.1 DUF808 domain-containing protein [Roseateles koreensis]
MAAASLLLLLDDISAVLDDVATLSKLAAKQTTGVLGDDLALNAQQVSGIAAERELPVVWAVAKGSFKNKAILVPGALAVSTWAPWAVTPALMVGGAYLCFEGFEKLVHKAPPHAAAPVIADTAAETPLPDLHDFETERIRGAVRTDFILSAEIIAITLGTVASAPFLTQVMVLTGIAILMTVGVYGLVAGIVKLDDLGLHLAQRPSAFSRALGRRLVTAAPVLMKILAVAGTVAMFLVGGGILAHGLPLLHEAPAMLASFMGPLAVLAPMLVNGLLGVVAGGLLLAGMKMLQGFRTIFS